MRKVNVVIGAGQVGQAIARRIGAVEFATVDIKGAPLSTALDAAIDR
jgi:predicted dinucleotide-binding enzyme